MRIRLKHRVLNAFRREKLMQSRVRCPVCGHPAFISRVQMDHPLGEQMDCYSQGDSHIRYERKIVPELKEFWVGRLLYVLSRLGWRQNIQSYTLEPIVEVPFANYATDFVPNIESEVSYEVG